MNEIIYICAVIGAFITINLQYREQVSKFAADEVDELQKAKREIHLEIERNADLSNTLSYSFLKLRAAVCDLKIEVFKLFI